MAGRAAPIAIVPSVERGCRLRRRRESPRSGAPAAPDRSALVQSARQPATRQHPRPDAEISGGEVSWRAPPEAPRKDRPFPGLARHRHVPAHYARELAGDAQAEAGAAVLPCGRRIGLGELLEQLGLLLRTHADASVGDRQLNPVATVSDPARPQRDLALLGELKGIA